MRLRRASGSGTHYDPRAEFAQAEQLSAHTHGYHHVQLERGWVQLREGGNPDPREAMETWRASGYALGVARYFNLRMNSLSQMGKVVEALEAGVAALLAAPAARTENARIWTKLFELRSVLQSTADLESVLEHAHARRGPLGDVESIARDHLDQNAEQIVELLRRPRSSLKMPVRSEEKHEPRSSSTDNRGHDTNE